MKAALSHRALIAIADAPAVVRKAFYKQLAFLEIDMRHHSPQAKWWGMLELAHSALDQASLRP
jgi:hypothetical protein